MTEDIYTPSELYQAERLERYLAHLDFKEVVPPDVQPTDIELFALARQFQTLHVQPHRLVLPITRQRWSIKKIVFWAIPLPLIASMAVWFFLWRSQSVDVTAELADIDAQEQALLAMEVELSSTLDEIDLLTSTDYIDQL